MFFSKVDFRKAWAAFQKSEAFAPQNIQVRQDTKELQQPGI